MQLAPSPQLMFRIRLSLNRWEKPVMWMYLDSKGLVTVGCGTLLASPDAAVAIPFYHADTLKDATDAEVRAEWTKLYEGHTAQLTAANKKKFGSQHYAKLTRLRIIPETADSFLDDHVKHDYASLKRIFWQFDMFPTDAKVALFDMIYNTGAGHDARYDKRSKRKIKATGLHRFATMIDAIRRNDWDTAAMASARKIDAARDRATAALFRHCAVADRGKVI